MGDGITVRYYVNSYFLHIFFIFRSLNKNGNTFRYEGPPRRRYYRRSNQGYTTYGSAQARSAYDRSSGQRWRYESEYSAAEQKEKLINTIFFGFALPLFLFADYIEAAFWPKPRPGWNVDGESRPEKSNPAELKKKVRKKAVACPAVQTSPVTPAIRDVPDQGCKSLLNRSVGYTYVVGRGLGKLESATNLAPKLPETIPHSTGPQNLRSLLSMENRLSDLRLDDIHKWLRHRTGVPGSGGGA